MATYNPHHDSAPISEVARRWAFLCLKADGSIFVDTNKLWTPSLLAPQDSPNSQLATSFRTGALSVSDKSCFDSLPHIKN